MQESRYSNKIIIIIITIIISCTDESVGDQRCYNIVIVEQLLAVGCEVVLVFDRDRRKQRPTSEVKPHNAFNKYSTLYT